MFSNQLLARLLRSNTLICYASAVVYCLTNNVSDNHDDDDDDDTIYGADNILLRTFHNCSVSVKSLVFNAYCLRLYNVAL